MRKDKSTPACMALHANFSPQTGPGLSLTISPRRLLRQSLLDDQSQQINNTIVFKSIMSNSQNLQGEVGSRDSLML